MTHTYTHTRTDDILYNETHTHALSGREERTIVCQRVVEAVSKAISQPRDCCENEIAPGTGYQLVNP